MKLVQAQIFFRHGARTPLHHIPTTVVKDAVWSPEYVKDHEKVFTSIETKELISGKTIPTKHYENLNSRPRLLGDSLIGTLTYKGQQQLLELGIKLREQYEDKLYVSDDPNSVYCRSTGFSRTVRSAQSLLTTLFNEKAELAKRSKIYVQFFGKDFLALTLDNNKYFYTLHNAGIKSCQEDYPQIKEVKSKIKNILKLNRIVDSFRNRNPLADEAVYVVRDDMVARKFHGFPVPEDLERISDEIEKTSTLELNVEYTGPEKFWKKNISYPTGPIIHEILFNIQNYPKLKRFRLYSAHDSTLMPLLLSLHAKKGVWPPYAAYITVETYSSDDSEEVNKLGSSAIGPIDSQEEKIKGKWKKELVDRLWFKIKFMDEDLSLDGVMGQTGHFSDKKLYPVYKLIEHWEPIAKCRSEYEKMKPDGIETFGDKFSL